MMNDDDEYLISRQLLDDEYLVSRQLLVTFSFGKRNTLKSVSFKLFLDRKSSMVVEAVAGCRSDFCNGTHKKVHLFLKDERRLRSIVLRSCFYQQ